MAFAAEDVVGGEEDDTGPDFGSRAGHIRGPDRVHSESMGRIELTVIDAVERGGVDDPIRLMLAQDARDTDPIGHIDITVGEPDGAVAKGPHQILAKLT